MKRSRRIQGLFAALYAGVALCGMAGAAEPTPYRETVVTPHWPWVERHAGGTIRALFLTEELAAREPAELAQRFDIEATILPVLGTTLGVGRSVGWRSNHRIDDPPSFAELLQEDWDVVVIACRLDNALSGIRPGDRTNLLDKVRAGMPLVVYRHGWNPRPEAFRNARLKTGDTEHDEGDPAYLLEAAGRALPLDKLVFRGPLTLPSLPLGEGRIHYVYGYNTHWTHRNAFLGIDPELGVHHPGAFENDFISPEVFYALAARWIRLAAGRESEYRAADITTPPPSLPVGVGKTLEIHVALHGKAENGDSLSWWLHDPAGATLERGVVRLSGGETDIKVTPKAPRAGRLAWRFRLERGGADHDFGAALIDIDRPAGFEAFEVSHPVNPWADVRATWRLSGAPRENDVVVLQLYDPDGQLLAGGRFAASAGAGVTSGCPPRHIAHRLRALLMRGEHILDETVIPVYLDWDRKRDTIPYHVNVWGFEQGSRQDVHRLRRLRQLGINAISVGGRNPRGAHAAAMEGLRAVPTNIRHPAERNRPTFDADKAAGELDRFAEAVASLAPPGYMLGDEPGHAEDVVPYTRWAAEIIRRRDPSARVGWSGVWMGFEKDAPTFFANCDFVTAYSPFHLYSPNLWMGMERDLYRSFARAGSIVTCWTHYAPWRDDEPYTRTTPWLWLFEGLNGVSYFSSDWEFAILPADLTTTHETRWWSREIAEISRGIGEQMIGMKRETGAIRILFSPGAEGADMTARALNRLNIPYRFMSRKELRSGVKAGVRLLFCPNVVELDDGEWLQLEAFVSGGGWLMATAPLGALITRPAAPPEEVDEVEALLDAVPAEPPEPREELVPAMEPPTTGKPLRFPRIEMETVLGAPDRLQPLFGIVRAEVPPELEAWRQQRDTYRNLRVSARGTETPAGRRLLGNHALNGKTLGEYGLRADDAQIVAVFDTIGDFRRGDEVNLEVVSRLFDTPAVFLRRHGSGAALYFTFRPDLEALAELIPRLMKEADAPPPSFRVTIKGNPDDDTVYLYPFRGDGDIRLVGVVRDYFSFYGTDTSQWRVPPDWKVTGGKETAGYFHHGPYIWKERPARLHGEAPAHGYDVRRGRYLGWTAVVDFPIRAGRPDLFAFLPYRLKEITVTAPETVEAGRDVEISITLKTDDGTPATHVAHLSLNEPNGEPMPGGGWNVHTTNGHARQRLRIPLNATPGDWRVTVRDAITGLEGQATLRVRPSPKADVGPPRPRQELSIQKIPLDWPQGVLEPVVIDFPKKEAVDVSGASMRVYEMPAPHSGECSHHRGLRADFTLRNADAYYQMRYRVCNDAEAHRFEDPRRIVAPYPPGLGIHRPNPMPWYVNGYIEVLFDDANLSGYAIRAIEEVKTGKNGRVDVHVGTPMGEYTLSFAMTPDRPALFQELRVRPAVPVETITVRFRRHEWGGEHAFIEIDPEHDLWTLTGDRLEDRAFGRGPGPAAMLIPPEQWDAVRFRPARPQLEKRVDLAAGEEARLHWALYLFPELSNADALTYMREQAHTDQQALRQLFEGN